MTQGKLQILNRDENPFRDRKEAGKQLALALKEFKGPATVVLGIPRGGLVVAHEIAHELKAPLDVVLSRKLVAPSNPELAIGAIEEDGKAFLDQSFVFKLKIGSEYIEQQKRIQLLKIKEYKDVFRSIRSKIQLKDKLAIVVDDGVATGSTAQAALWSIRHQDPSKIVGAFPVAAEKVLHRLTHFADEIICVKVPDYLEGIGKFYYDFNQVSLEEVIRILNS